MSKSKNVKMSDKTNPNPNPLDPLRDVKHLFSASFSHATTVRGWCMSPRQNHGSKYMEHDEKAQVCKGEPPSTWIITGQEISTPLLTKT